MKHKIAHVIQPAGLGDIIFGMKIAHKLLEKAEKVVWPVISEFAWLDTELSRDERISYPAITSENNNGAAAGKDDLLINLQSADQTMAPVDSVMYCKYEMLGLDYSDWAKYFDFHYRAKAEDLHDLVVADKGFGDGYIVVNRNFGSPPNMNTCQHLNIDTDLGVVEMQPIEGFTMFDWYMVLEGARQIHTAETSLPYLIEVLNCKGLNMYSKHAPPHYQHVRNLFRKEWVWHL